MGYNEVVDGGVWKPEVVGEKLEGTIKSREVRKGQNDEPYTSFTIEELSGGEERKVSGKVLEGKLGELEDGTRILLTYKGKSKTKNGNYFKDFSVMVWSNDDKPAL